MLTRFLLACGLLLAACSTANATVGTQTVYSTSAGNNGIGRAQDYRFPATPGSVSTLHVYLSGTSTASKVELGIYAGSASKAGSRAGRCFISSPQANAWNSCTFSPAYAVSGNYVWLAILQPTGTTGTMIWREGQVAGGPTTYLSNSGNLSDLPSTWSNGQSFTDGSQGSIYGDSSTQQPPPTAAFTVSPVSPTTGQAVTFDGSGSTCAATPCSYHYIDTANGADLGDSQVSQFTFQATGTKFVQLTVTDAQNRSATVEHDVIVSASGGGGGGGGSCTQKVTTSTFASAFASANAGSVLCLAPGNYGTFNGGSKTAPGVTITSDASAGGTQANVIFDAANLGGSQNITLDNLTFGPSSSDGVSIQSNPTNIVISNDAFKGDVEIDNIQSSNHANVLFSHDDFAHTGLDCSSLQGNALFGLHYSGAAHSGVTVQNSAFGNTDCDGIHTGTALDVLNNTFTNICEDSGSDPQHTDNMQFEGSVGGRIAGNYFHETLACTTQGLTSYDGYTNGVTLEDNVVDIGRPFGIEWYGDINSTIRHNTVVYRATGCEFNQPCGQIIIDCKPSEFICGVNAGFGTQVYDNLATVASGDGATMARNDHNMSAQTVVYQGGSNPPPDGGFAAFSDYLLAPGSPGKGAADDGSDIGIFGVA